MGGLSEALFWCAAALVMYAGTILGVYLAKLFLKIKRESM